MRQYINRFRDYGFLANETDEVIVEKLNAISKVPAVLDQFLSLPKAQFSAVVLSKNPGSFDYDAESVFTFLAEHVPDEIVVTPTEEMVERIIALSGMPVVNPTMIDMRRVAIRSTILDLGYDAAYEVYSTGFRETQNNFLFLRTDTMKHFVHYPYEPNFFLREGVFSAAIAAGFNPDQLAYLLKYAPVVGAAWWARFFSGDSLEYLEYPIEWWSSLLWSD